MRGLDRTEAMLAIIAHALPRLEVDRARCARGARGRRARDRRGDAARGAGRAVPDGVPRGGGGARARASGFAAPSPAKLVARRVVHRRPRQPRPGSEPRPALRRGRALAARRERRRFDRAMRQLTGRPDRRRPTACPPVMTADRRKRHLKILELISTRAVRTQEELAEALAAEGWEVTQSSVSRDIAALRLVKVDGAYRRPARCAIAGGSRTSAGSPRAC